MTQHTKPQGIVFKPSR